MTEREREPGPPAPHLRKLRVKIGREVRWLWVDAQMAVAIQTYDKFIRRRNKVFRAHHATNVSETELTTRRLNSHARPMRLVGFLNAELEAATEKLGLRHAEKPGRWEGPRVAIDRYLGDSMTWTGANFGSLVRAPYGDPDAPRSATQLVFKPHRTGPCPVCADAPLGGTLDGEVIVSIVCLWCGRSNVNDKIMR